MKVSPPMRITIVVGGRWHAFDLARHLHHRGHLHRLITTYPRWFVKRWGIPAEKVVSLPLAFVVVKAIYKLGGEALMMRCQWWVHSWFARGASRHLEGSQLIHGWSQWSEPSLRWACQRGVPTVLERSSAHILEQSRLLREEHQRLCLPWPATHPRIEAMELREYGLCTTVAVPSLFVERSFLARGFPPERLFRNGLGVDLSRFRPPDRPPPPPSLGLRVVYAGSLSVRKGLPDLLAGFAAAKLPGAELLLLGGGGEGLDALLARQPAAVRRLGHRPQAELVAHYGTAHCFVMASIEEGMAMVQMQALACGLPLICTPNTGGEDLLRLQGTTPRIDPLEERSGAGAADPSPILEFPAGWVVPIHAPEAIAHCLRRLSREVGLWEGKRRAALELAQGALGWDAYGERAIVHYRSLLSDGDP
ncbi:MAG: glycosyltransferase family 4 protein [Cyanobacteriota bacterium]|nr:glycosyltransferase family 4 protein [Cyanobacteriota bacterium]